MIASIARRRWLAAAVFCVLLAAALTAWALAPAEGAAAAAVGAVSVLALGAAAIGLVRAAAAQRALAGDLDMLRQGNGADQREAERLRAALARAEQRLSLAERRIAALAIKLDLTEDEDR
ncbi:MAG: hypothetical protein KJZ75_06330 [Hyphomonadaceae bacterium]|nr:hypothetical protein [Hyphomonadaceae bacterium]GIK47437.1 MAG: hypothetical protein BroJett013_01340 [Alphaproteobacteria bacterium]